MPPETVMPEAERIEVSTPVIRLSPGEYGQAVDQILPKPNRAALIFSSEDPSVAEVDYYGVVRAVSPGTVTLHIKADDETVPAVEVTVIVK